MYGRAIPRRFIKTLTVTLSGCCICFALLRCQSNHAFYSRIVAPGNTVSPAIEAQHVPPELDLPSYCSLISVDNISFVIKTGATEAQLKLPPQLKTAMRCVADPLLFSDLEQSIGPYQVHDILSRVSPSATANNPDFDIYSQQRALQTKGQEADIPYLLGNAPIPGGETWRTRGRSAGWALDKYKFLHMIERAWELQPDREWYVFLEADTYLSLRNLQRFLVTLNPEEKLYLGSAVRMWEHPTTLYFAHGGSGLVLSGALVRDFAVERKGIAGRYDKLIGGMWYGDYALAVVLQEHLGVKVQNVWPFMQGGNPSEVAFGNDIWCQPVGTLHHMTAEDFDAIYEHEKAASFEGMLFRDVFATIFSNALPEREVDWDNGSDDGDTKIEIISDGTNTGTESPDDSWDCCEHECSQRRDCLQFSYHTFENQDKNGCHLSTIFRLGHKTGSEDTEFGQSISSGWMNARIASWVDEHRDCARRATVGL